MAECPLVPWMKESGISQADLARAAALHPPQVSLFLRGKGGLRPPALQRLADATHGKVSVATLLVWRFSLAKPRTGRRHSSPRTAAR